MVEVRSSHPLRTAGLNEGATYLPPTTARKQTTGFF